MPLNNKRMYTFSSRGDTANQETQCVCIFVQSRSKCMASSRSECKCPCFLLSVREQSMMYNLPCQGTQQYLANIQTQSLGVVEKIEVSVLVSLCEANQETYVLSLCWKQIEMYGLLLSLNVQISKKCLLLSAREQLRICSRCFLFKGAHRRTCSPSLRESKFWDAISWCRWENK